MLFSGDTLFPGGPGDTKFEGGDFATIIDSIDNRLFTLPADTIVMPGHGDDTTIGAERRTSRNGSTEAGEPGRRDRRRRTRSGSPLPGSRWFRAQAQGRRCW